MQPYFLLCYRPGLTQKGKDSLASRISGFYIYCWHALVLHEIAISSACSEMRARCEALTNQIAPFSVGPYKGVCIYSNLRLYYKKYYRKSLTTQVLNIHEAENISMTTIRTSGKRFHWCSGHQTNTHQLSDCVGHCSDSPVTELIFPYKGVFFSTWWCLSTAV